eukprot:3780744-Rhodomonas_salina.1
MFVMPSTVSESVLIPQAPVSSQPESKAAAAARAGAEAQRRCAESSDGESTHLILNSNAHKPRRGEAAA